MPLIQIFSNELNFENNLFNSFIEKYFKLINIEKEIIFSIDKSDILKNNNLFCYIKFNNDLFLNVNIYIKGKPYNLKNFYLVKNFNQKIENLNLILSDFENIEIETNKLLNFINSKKTILNEFLKDLNINSNLEIDKIFKIKKYIIFKTDKNFIEINNFMEYFINNEQIDFTQNSYILRLISNIPIKDEKEYKDFIEILNKNKININENINKLYFYI